MAKVPKRTSVDEMLLILNKQWLDTQDIRKLACVGEAKARKIKYEIRDNLLAENWFLPEGLVPSEKVVDYLNLNIKYLKKIGG